VVQLLLIVTPSMGRHAGRRSLAVWGERLHSRPPRGVIVAKKKLTEVRARALDPVGPISQIARMGHAVRGG